LITNCYYLIYDDYAACDDDFYWNPSSDSVMRKILSLLQAKQVGDQSDSDFCKFQARCNNHYEETINIRQLSNLFSETSKRSKIVSLDINEGANGSVVLCHDCLKG
jgi:hypothetical protein